MLYKLNLVYDKALKYIWLIVLMTAFFGVTLSIKGLESLFAYRVLLGLNLLLFTISFLRRHRLDIKHEMYPYYVFLALWFVWALISMLWAPNKGAAVRGIFLLFCNINLIFFTAYYMDNITYQKRMLMVFFIAWSINIAVAFVEITTGFHLAISRMNEYEGIRLIPTAFYKNPNDFAAYLVVYLPVVYAAFIYAKKYISILYILFISGFYVLLHTNSRASYMAFLLTAAVAVFLAVIFDIKYRRSWSKSIKRRMLAVLVGIALILVLDTINIIPEKQGKSLSMFDQIGTLNDVQEGNSMDVRMNLIKNGFKILNENPLQYLTGIGAGNLESRMSAYAYNTNGLINMHNWWLELLVEYGLIITICFIVFYLKIMAELFKIYVASPSRWYRLLAEGLLLSLVAFSLASISPSSIKSISSLWAIFGASLSLIGTYKLEMENIGHEDTDIISHVS